MTTEEDDLMMVIEQSIEQMEGENLAPDDWEVYTENDELWANIWFKSGAEMPLEDRKERALPIIQEVLTESTSSLPVSVNANFQADATERGIACWWQI